MSPAHGRRGPSIDTIKALVAVDSGVSVLDLESDRRDAQTVRARFAAMYLARTMTPLSLPVIGRLFGNRDHTTVLHAIRKTANQIETSPEKANEMARLRRFLEPKITYQEGF